MKKLLLYILIIVAFTGILGIAQNAQATEWPGICTITNKGGERGIKTTTETTTYNKCQRKASPPFITIQWAVTCTDPNTIPQGNECIPRPVVCEPPSIVRGRGCACEDPNAWEEGKCIAPTPPPNSTTSYTLLSPLPGLEGPYEITPDNPLGRYLNTAINLFIGICAVLAMIMIVVGGLEYMTSELVSSKESGKSKMTQAIFGLLLALGAWTILNTINPDLLNADLKNMGTVAVTVELGGEGSAPFVSRTPQALQAIGITCSGGKSNLATIAQSFVGKSVYSMEHRNDIRDGKAHVDCSSFVSQVYACAGLGNPGGTTAGIFGSAGTLVTGISDDGTKVNGTALRVGDLLGWKAGDNGIAVGHVVMYIGNGKIIDASGSMKGVTVRTLSSYKYLKNIKYINRVNAGTSGDW